MLLEIRKRSIGRVWCSLRRQFLSILLLSWGPYKGCYANSTETTSNLLTIYSLSPLRLKGLVISFTLRLVDEKIFKWNDLIRLHFPSITSPRTGSVFLFFIFYFHFPIISQFRNTFYIYTYENTVSAKVTNHSSTETAIIS